jgi:repressor LexA
MTLADILREYKAKTGCSNDYIATQTLVTKSTVSRWISGEIKKVQDETLELISKMTGIDVKEALKDSFFRYQKPIIGLVKAGYDLLAEENHLGQEEVTAQENKQGDFFLRVVGNSMEGAKIHDGDLVFVEATNDVSNGEIAVIMIDNQELTIKRVIKKANMLILEAANPSYENLYFTNEEIKTRPLKIIGRVLYSKTIFK